MKLATYDDGSRDGQLVVVSRDLGSAHYATGIATRLQQVLDDWNFLSPQLEDLYTTLNHGKTRHAFEFDPRRCRAPLPRAGQWVQAQAYVRADEPPMRHGPADHFLGPRDDLVLEDGADGIDFEAGIAVVTGDVPRGSAPERALDGVRLMMLASQVCLRNPAAGGQTQDFGPLHSRPVTAFGPVAVTPDEWGDAWRGGRVEATLQLGLNDEVIGRCATGSGMTFPFGQLIAHLCRTRDVRAGSIVGACPVSHPESGAGAACLAQRRAAETIEFGEPRTPFLRFGDRLRIEVVGRDGDSVLGAIEQRIASATSPNA